MKKLVLSFALALLFGCGGSSPAAAPVISKFTLSSPISTSASLIHGSVYVEDSAGLDNLTADMTVTGPLSTALSVPVSGSASSETAATLPLELLLGSSIPAGTYKVSISLSESGAVSNSLDATLVVQ